MAHQLPTGGVYVLTLGLALGGSLLAAKADDAELVQQAERQKQIQADTDHAVRRLGTMLRVLEYYQVDKAAEKQLLAEVAATLAGLSRSQMNEVIARLETAAQTPDAAKAEKEVTVAYARHREIIDTLKEMLARYDAVKTLDQVADRLDKQSQVQLDLHLFSGQLLQDWSDRGRGDLPRGQRLALLNRLRYQSRDLKKQVDDQAELRKDVTGLLQQAAGLRGKLNDEQKARLSNMEKLADKLRLHDNLANIQTGLRLAGRIPKTDSWQEANERQWQTSGHLKALARALRTPADLLAILREARARLDLAIAKQGDLEEQTKEQVEVAKKLEAEQAAAEQKKKLTFADLENLLKPDKTKPADTKAEKKQAMVTPEQAKKNLELAKQQARLEDETRSTRDLIQEHAKPAADKVEAAEEAMKDARAELKKNETEKAMPAQEKAADKLKEARRDIDQMIAAALKQKTDPLAAMKKAADNVEKLLKEQMETRDQTKTANKEKQNAQMPELTAKQQDLAKRTEAMKDTPLPAQPETKKALARANEAMKDAAKELMKEKPGEAVPKQDMAIKALEQAKNDLGQKIAEMENRRDAMAKLEDAAKKLGELAKQENMVAKGAQDLMKQPNADAAKNLAQKQENLKPPTKEVGQQLEKAAPMAAKKVDQAGKQMAAAKNNLDKNQAPPAAMEAKEAAKNLMEAQKEVAKALEDMKGKELADQAAMQPNKVDANQAAQQVAKALEQTRQAAEQAMQAEQAGKKMAQANPENAMQKLAKMQEQVAKNADQMKLPQAGKEADMAAKALHKGDLPKAVQQQEAALAKMEEAAKKPDMPHAQAKPGEAKDAAMKPGEAKSAAKAGEKMADNMKPGEAKAGEKMAGDAKNTAKAGEKMAGDAKPGEAKPGEAKPGEKMPGQAKNPAQLAQMQKDVMEATKALAKSQEATQAAMAALAQAQAQAPKGVQPPLDMANKELAKANQDLNMGEAGEANKAQNQAAKQLEKALDQLNAALAAMGQQPVKPGQASQAIAKGEGLQPGKEGDQPMDGQGQEAGQQPMPGQGQAQAKGQGPSQQKGQAQEKNQPQGQGNRDADGKVANAKSQLNDVRGDGSFLHLPPRQRELIRQALSGQLPPEYAALIQQYYINIARDRPAAMPTTTPRKR